MAKKLRLDSDDSHLYTFVAVACHMPDYRFLYFVNHELKMNFLRLPDLPVFFEKEAISVDFPLFYFDDESNRQDFFCISCRSGAYTLINELPRHDYLIIRVSEHKLFNTKEFTSHLKGIKEVLLTSLIPYTSMKQIQGILIDLEMHMTSLQKEEKSKFNPSLNQRNQPEISGEE